MKFVLDKGYILEQGIEQGIEQKNIDVIKNMLSLNTSIEDIAKVVELSVDEVRKIIVANNLAN